MYRTAIYFISNIILEILVFNDKLRTKMINLLNNPVTTFHTPFKIFKFYLIKLSFILFSNTRYSYLIISLTNRVCLIIFYSYLEYFFTQYLNENEKYIR